MTWREAFHKQARDDYDVFCRLNKANDPIHRQLHYLQMSTEKIAKAYSSGDPRRHPALTHAALTSFLKVTKGRPEMRRQMGFGSDRHAFASYLDSLLPVAREIEILAPARTDKPNPEYPWQETSGNVIAPVDFGFDSLWKRQTEIARLRKLVGHLVWVVKP